MHFILTLRNIKKYSKSSTTAEGNYNSFKYLITKIGTFLLTEKMFSEKINHTSYTVCIKHQNKKIKSLG